MIIIIMIMTLVKQRDIRFGARLMIVCIRTAEQGSAVFRSKRVVGSLNWDPEP
jgi:hypothetical protein